MPSVDQTEPDVTAVAPRSGRSGSLLARARIRGRALPDGLGWSLVVYAISRVPVVLGLVAYWARNPEQDYRTTALRQDGWWYVRLAEDGYSTSLRAPVTTVTDFHHTFSEWGFFPGYPLVTRAVHTVTFLPYLEAALLAAAVLGLLAVWAVYTMGATFGGRPAGRASALLVAAWPGSAVFSLPYSEGLFLAATAMALVYLQRERWVAAGLFGLVAALTRPTGSALIAAGGVVAVVQLVRRHDPRALIAPVLTALGPAAFLLYGWYRTGDLLVWRHAENLWMQRLDLSRVLIQKATAVFEHPVVALHSVTGRAQLSDSVIDAVGALLLLAMAAAAVALRRRLSIGWVTYALVAAALVVAYSAVAPRPRTVLAILPGFVWLAAWLPRRVLYVLCALCLVATPFVVYVWSWRVSP